MSTFADLLGPDLSTKTGSKPTADALAGAEVVGLYFSAHWCGPCRQFTPELAAFYKKLVASGKKFEIVFVSSDRDESSFDSYYAEHPWLALPYAARDLKTALSKKFKVQGIPTFVLLDANAKTLTVDGRETIGEDPEGFPWAKKDLLELLGGRDDFEFIYVSSDRSTGEFSEYFKDMPWLGIPNGDPRKAALSSHFKVQGIPTFVMIDEEGKTINDSARGSVMGDPTGAKFPWAKEAAADMEDGPEGLNETTSVVALLEGLGGAAQQVAVDALLGVATSVLAAGKAVGEEEAPFCFFYAKTAECVRKLTSQPATNSAGTATLLLLDIPEEGAYYVSAATEVTAASVRQLLEDYAAQKLERKQLGQ
ncbi:thioredoxin-like-domain-containing protein [Pavlovales sp. CCMP2436]|nr:thioredoxin-like-domain-containing protein [Pavlovales sp. CCMP2436]